MFPAKISERATKIREGKRSKQLSLWARRGVCRLVYYQLITRVSENIYNTRKIVLLHARERNLGTRLAIYLVYIVHQPIN